VAFYYTSDELIKSVKMRASVPTSQNRFKNEDFLRFANEEMALGLVPSILRNHEDYFLISEDVMLVEGKQKYAIPYRSIGNKLRELSFIDANDQVYEMTRIGVGDVPFYTKQTGNGIIYAYYVANNEICLVPEKTNIPFGAKLRFSYYVRPNTLVLLENVAIISGIDRTTGVISFSQLPQDFSTSLQYDIVQVKSPHKCLKMEFTATAINSTSKTMTLALADIPTDLAVGDHVTKATESAIPQVPSDMHMILAHRVATRLMEAMGDTEGLQNANQKLSELEQQANTLIDDRVEDSPKKVVNRHAILRTGLQVRRFRRIRG
jgi:hypothetical protein